MSSDQIEDWNKHEEEAKDSLNADIVYNKNLSVFILY